MNDEYLDALKVAAERASARSITHSRTGPRVGAAVLTVGGEIASGAYLAGATAFTTVHAEVAALIAAVMGVGSKHVRAVAVFASVTQTGLQLVPCGNCLQFIAEHAISPDIVIVTSTSALLPDWESMTLASLLPRPWTGW